MKQSMQVLTSSESNSWYTPLLYVEAARRVMGGIDLDPASIPAVNNWIKAKKIYTIEDDGLTKTWRGSIFCNPPYGKTNGKSNQEIWTDYALHQYAEGFISEAIILTKTVPGYKWWETLFRGLPVCMCRERIAFWKIVDGETIVGGKAKMGTSFWYIGPQKYRFRDVFSKIGRVILPPHTAGYQDFNY